MRSWLAGLATLAGVVLVLVGCGGAKSSQQRPATSSSTASRTPTASHYSARQVERAFRAAGIRLKRSDFGLGHLPCPFFAAARDTPLDLVVSTCGDQGETIGANLRIRQLLQKANVLVSYQMHTGPRLPSPASTIAKITHALALLPGNDPVTVVHLQAPPDLYTPFSADEVERLFKDAGVPLKAVQPINLSGFPDSIRSASPQIELQAAAPLPRRNFVRIIVSRHINLADPEHFPLSAGEETSPEHSGDAVIFNVYVKWKLSIPLMRNVKTAINRLYRIATARTIITLGY